MRHEKITKPFIKISIFLLCGGGAIFLHCCGIGCVWKHFFGIECPGCGMTRAYLSLLKFDIAAAFRFHPMFWTLPVVLLYILYDGKLFDNKIINNAILIAIAIGFTLNYIFMLMR